MAAELPWLWARPQGESVLPRIVALGGRGRTGGGVGARKGVIIVSPHVGSWEILGQAVGERFCRRLRADHGAVPAGAQELDGRADAGSRDRPGLQTLPTSLAGVRGLMRTLRAGGYTGMLPDQVPPQGMGVWAPFSAGRLHHDAGGAPGAADRRRVLLAWGERLPRGARLPRALRALRRHRTGDAEGRAEAAAAAR